jgi:hypothetical protein
MEVTVQRLRSRFAACERGVQSDTTGIEEGFLEDVGS